MAPTDNVADLAESELIARLRADRDRRSYAELYRRERRSVFGLCLRILREPGRAEDACHEAFVRAWEGFAGLRGDAFGPWVRRIAKNLCLNELRHENIVREAPVYPPDNPGGAAEDWAISSEELDRAGRIIESLSAPQRSVFLLRHLEGCSHREIGERTGMNENEIRSHLQNARRNFHIAWQRRAPAAEDNEDG